MPFFASEIRGITACVAAKDVGTTWELTSFVVASTICLFAVRPLFSGVIYKRSESKPVLVQAMIGKSGMVVDEIDKARGEHAYDPLGALYSLLEHDTASCFTDEFAEVSIDASQVIADVAELYEPTAAAGIPKMRER